MWCTSRHQSSGLLLISLEELHKTLIEDGHIGNYQVPPAPLTFYFRSLAHARPIDACTCSPIVIPSIGTEHSTAICNWISQRIAHKFHLHFAIWKRPSTEQCCSTRHIQMDPQTFARQKATSTSTNNVFALFFHLPFSCECFCHLSLFAKLTWPIWIYFEVFFFFFSFLCVDFWTKKNNIRFWMKMTRTWKKCDPYVMNSRLKLMFETTTHNQQ